MMSPVLELVEHCDSLEGLQEQLKDEEARRLLQRRITELTPLLQETRELAALTAHYYDRSYHRHERYTL